jgi:superfamily II DNA or RNA helicase
VEKKSKKPAPKKKASTRKPRMPKIYLSDKIYIPVRFVDEDRLKKAYTHCEFDDNICRGCDMRNVRPCEDCYACEWGGLKQTFCMAGHRMVSGNEYYTTPLGDIDNVEYKLGIDFDDFELVDKTTKRQFTYPLKFTGNLFDYQEDPVRIICKKKMGILKSKPRTGKTVMAVAAICRMKQRAIIMADQKDFLDGFLETFEALTNMKELEEQAGTKLIGFPKTLKDYETFQVILVTYQQLIKDSEMSRKRLKLLRMNYGTLAVDEVHRTCAPEFSKVLGKMKARSRFGLSATPKKKNKREVLAYNLIGPVIATTRAEAMCPTIVVHPTPDTVRTKAQFNGQAGWTKFCQFLARHEDRNMQIVEMAVKDVKAGRSVCIPIMYKEHADKLKREIDFALGYDTSVVALFMGGSKEAKKRKQVVDDARSGKIKVVIGIRSLIQLGINIPCWDTLYYIMPMSNEPNWEQESYRILTPMPDKPTPRIRMFLDKYMQRSVGCFKVTLQASMKFNHQLSEKSRAYLQNEYGSAIYDVPRAGSVNKVQANSILSRSF